MEKKGKGRAWFQATTTIEVNFHLNLTLKLLFPMFQKGAISFSDRAISLFLIPVFILVPIFFKSNYPKQNLPTPFQQSFSLPVTAWPWMSSLNCRILGSRELLKFLREYSLTHKCIKKICNPKSYKNLTVALSTTYDKPFEF